MSCGIRGVTVCLQHCPGPRTEVNVLGDLEEDEGCWWTHPRETSHCFSSKDLPVRLKIKHTSLINQACCLCCQRMLLSQVSKMPSTFIFLALLSFS